MDARILDSILWHALAKAGEQQAKPLRGDLPAGSKTSVAVSVDGTVDGRPVHAAIGGELTVGHDGSYQKTETCDVVKLLALCLQAMPRTRRIRLCEDLPKAWASGELPEPDAASFCAASNLAPQLTRTVVKPKSGTVSFVRPPDEPAAEKSLAARANAFKLDRRAA